MNTRFFLLLFAAVILCPLALPESLACSKDMNLSFFLPWNEYLHGDCSVTTGTLSWTGMVYIMFAFVIPTIVIHRKKKLQKKFYLVIPAIILIIMIFYSVFIYGTPDVTQFTIPHGIYGGIDYDTVASQDTHADFAKLLAERNVAYSDEYMDTKYDYTNHVYTDNLEYQINMPANYCGFVISSSGEKFWYTAVFDRIITSSKLYKENPYDCHPDSDECVCGMQERITERFVENEK